MDVFRGYQNLPPSKRARAVAIGNFDGVHRGHQQVLRVALEEARALDGEALVLTFDPHPAKVLAPDLAPPLLCTLSERLAQFARAGISATVIEPFNRDFAKKTPTQFVEEILVGMGVRCVVVGYDFSFGARRAGNFETLRQLCEEHSIRARRVEAFAVDGLIASSTKIRELILEGRVKGAALLLGRPFCLTGEIVRGAARGRTIGFPTANLKPEEEILPKTGVYACRARIAEEDTWYDAVVNVGFAPTFGEGALTVEAHLLDVERELYGQRMRLAFLERIRSEKKFSGIEELKAQIAQDAKAARQALQNAAPVA